MRRRQKNGRSIPPLIQSHDPLSRLIRECKSGDVLPIISNTFIHNLLLRELPNIVENGDAELLSNLTPHFNLQHRWAKAMDFNLGVANDFATTSQYLLVIRDESDRQVKQLYLQFLSSILDLLMDDNLYEIVNTDLDAESWTFTEKAEKVEVEGGALIGFEQGQENALLQLADLDFPIYLTTSYHGLLETALRRANKEPQVEYFRWNDRLKLAPPLLDKNFEPSPQQPLVYHLHGIDSEPSSLVLTEEDHLEFLIFLRNEIETIMPVAVREALINDSLLMLGFQPEAWDFKILFHGLIKQRLNPPKSVCVQVTDTGPNILYVENYLRQAKFEVIWDDTFHFLKKLWQEVKE